MERNGFVLKESSGREFRHGPDGVQFRSSAESGWEDVPDDFALPHVFTFAGLVQGASKTYWHDKWDEALIDSRKNALHMRRDAFLMRLLRERKEGVASLKWHIEADNPKDTYQKFVADSLTKILRGIPYLRRYLSGLQEAIWYGRSAMQHKLMWRVMDLPMAQPPAITSAVPSSNAGMSSKKMRVLTVKKHRPINGDKLGWTWDDVPYVLTYGGAPISWGEQIITTLGPAVKLSSATWRERFTFHTHDPEDADWFEPERAARIHGVGIRDRIYFLNFMRLEYMSWVADVLERIGLGLVVMYFDQGNKKSEDAARAAAKNYSRRSVLLMPRSNDQRLTGGGVEIVDAPVAGAEFLQALWGEIRTDIEMYVLGQVISGGEGGPGGLNDTGRSMFAKDTKSKIIAADADELAESMTGSEFDPSLLTTIKRWTFPDADFPVRFCFNTEDADPEAKAKLVETLANLGVTFSMDRTREISGEPKPEDDEETIGGVPLEMGPDGQPFNPFDKEGAEEKFKGKKDKEEADAKEKDAQAKEERYQQQQKLDRLEVALGESTEKVAYQMTDSLEKFSSSLHEKIETQSAERESVMARLDSLAAKVDQLAEPSPPPPAPPVEEPGNFVFHRDEQGNLIGWSKEKPTPSVEVVRKNGKIVGIKKVE